METAAKILVLGGVLNIAYGLLTGIPAAMIRQKSPTYPKYLHMVHIGALMWGPILLGLALAIHVSTLGKSLELIAAVLMVGASFLLDAKDTINWLQGTEDEFVQNRTFPLLLGGLSALASLISIFIILIGVIQGL